MKNKDFIQMALTNIFNIKSDNVLKENLDAYFKLFDKEAITLLDDYHEKTIAPHATSQVNSAFSFKMKNELLRHWMKSPIVKKDWERIEKYFSLYTHNQQVKLSNKFEKDVKQKLQFEVKDELPINEHIRQFEKGNATALQKYVQTQPLKTGDKSKIYHHLNENFRNKDVISIFTLINTKAKNWSSIDILDTKKLKPLTRKLMTDTPDLFETYYKSYTLAIEKAIDLETDKRFLKDLNGIFKYKNLQIFSSFIVAPDYNKFDIKEEFIDNFLHYLSNDSPHKLTTNQKENFIDNFNFILNKEPQLSLKIKNKLKLSEPVTFESLCQFAKKELDETVHEEKILLDTIEQLQVIKFHKDLNNSIDSRTVISKKTIKI